jgi:ATP-binding cassette, subfamily B, bacterial PglK
VSRIMQALQSMRFSLPAVDVLYRELSAVHKPVSRKRLYDVSFESALVLDGITFQYDRTDLPALHGVSVKIPHGTSVGIIGESGAGKTTLVDVILGLLKPTQGRVLLDGADIQTNLRAWQDQIGYVPQSVFLTDDTIRRNVAFGVPLTDIDNQAVRRAIRAAQLEEFVAALPEGLDTIVGERGVKLSGGQRQRIGIARALYHNPAVLVLDEATSSLDSGTERGVMEAVSALHGDKTILIVAHRLSTVEDCDHIFRLEKGELVEEGTYESVVKLQTIAR